MLAVVVSLGAGLLWYRGAAARAELEVVEFRAAYNLLAERMRQQNDAVQEWERRAAQAAAAGRKARAEAAGAVEVAKRHADALGRAMAAPRPVGDCLPGEAVRVIRADLAASE
jgi:hypothetical protein